MFNSLLFCISSDVCQFSELREKESCIRCGTISFFQSCSHWGQDLNIPKFPISYPERGMKLFCESICPSDEKNIQFFQCCDHWGQDLNIPKFPISYP